MDKKKKSILEKSKEDIIKELHEDTEHILFNRKSKHFKKLEDDKEAQKYIKEMQDMEEKNEKRNNRIIVSSVAVVVCLFVGLGINILTSPYHKTENKKTSTEITNETKKENPTDVSEENSLDKEKDKASVNFKVYTFAVGAENRKACLDRAAALNGGSYKGIPSYFIAEILRGSGVQIPKTVSNTKDIVANLTSLGWQKDTDVSKLKKGDICFTSDMDGMPGNPSHVYLFMGWVKEGMTDYAYVCDSQIEEYKDSIHKRNIDFETEKKQKLNFFLRK